jgi:ribosomal protein S18 acetylase RimI-like enzyme
MRVYPAELTDLNICCQINGAYTTDYVWQMQTTGVGRRIEIRFDTVRLPRPMQVAYPRSPDELLAHWQQDGCFLVAQNDEGEVVGFIEAQPQPEQNILWVRNLVVDRPFRRQGYGALLLKSAQEWAIQHRLNNMMLEIQTKNFPAVSFAQKLGFHFCGYNEHYYKNGDITLYFYQTI